MRVLPPSRKQALVALVTRFRNTALDKADGLPCRRDRELHQQLAEVVWHLQRLGAPGTIALKALLEDASPQVRRWIAPHLLAGGEAAGRDVLVRDSALPGVCGEEARMALRDCLAGRLVSPFSVGEPHLTLLSSPAERRTIPGRGRAGRRPMREAVRPETTRELAGAVAATK